MEHFLARIVLYVRDLDRATRFYRDQLGLEPVAGDAKLGSKAREFATGACRLALHRTDGPLPAPSGRMKLVFYAADVAARREEFVRAMRTGIRPDGIPFRISDRNQ